MTLQLFRARSAVPLCGLLVFVVFGFACTTTGKNLPSPSPSADPLVNDPYQAVSSLVAMGNMDKAIEAYKKAAAKDENSPESQVLMGTLLLGAGKTDDALKLLTSLEKSETKNPDLEFALYLAAAQKGDRPEQEKRLRATIALNPNHAAALAALGEMALEDRKYTDAEKSFQTSLKNEPENMVALVGLGAVYARNDKLDLAEQLLDKATTVDPGYAFAWADLGKVQAANQRYDLAEKNLDKAIELDGGYPWNYLDRGRIEARAGKFDEATKDFTQVVRLNPSIFLAYAYRAQMLVKTGNTTGARQDYENTLQLRPDYYPAYEPIALLYYKEANFDGAAQYFEKAFNTDQQNENVLLLGALSFYMKGDIKGLESYSARVERKMNQQGPYYAALSDIRDPNRYVSTMARIDATPSEVDRLKAKVAIALVEQKLGRGRSAEAILRDARDKIPPESSEFLLSTWTLNEQP